MSGYIPIPAETSDSMRLVKALGVVGTTGLAGMMYSATFYTVPTLLLAPPTLAAKQWNVMFQRGLYFVPPTAAALASIFGFVSYRAHTDGRDSWRLFAGAAALLPLAVVPYTLLVMAPTNNELVRRATDAAASAAAASPSTIELIKKWGVLNTWRSLFLLSAASVGAWASLSEV